MMLIVVLTGLVGFFASYTLLQLELEELWLRYPLAVGIAYLAFLFFLGCWVLTRDDSLSNLIDDVRFELPEIAKSIDASSFGDIDLAELGLVALIIAALIGIAIAAAWIIWSSPILFAELILDTAIASGLYPRLKGVEGYSWLKTAVRHTIWPFLTIAVLFTIGGAAMQLCVPEAKSIGEVVMHYYKEN